MRAEGMGQIKVQRYNVCVCVFRFYCVKICVLYESFIAFSVSILKIYKFAVFILGRVLCLNFFSIKVCFESEKIVVNKLTNNLKK